MLYYIRFGSSINVSSLLLARTVEASGEVGTQVDYLPGYRIGISDLLPR
jgi:hypothetical protein